MKQGDMVQLGRHRLLCGDAFNSEHVDALMQGVKPDMLYCDPPYGIGPPDKDKRTQTWIKKPNGDIRYIQAKAGRTLVGDDKDLDIATLIACFDDVTEQFWWGADYYAERIESRNEGSWITWDKRVDPALDSGFGSCFELCWSRSRHKRELARIPWSGFIGMREEPDGKRHHPTQKPVALAEWFLGRYSKPGEVILDLFGGSGSTLLACERMERNALCMEISPDYCDVIIQRYEQMTQ